MSQIPTISRVLIVPGLPLRADDSLQNTHFQSISIGLVIDGSYVVWGEYQPDIDNAVSILQEKITPVLEGRPLDAFREIMDVLDALTETAVLNRPVTPAQTGSVSRRGFLTGNLTAEPAIKHETVMVERPLSPAMRCCVSQILLTALAYEKKQPVAELIATSYDLSWPPAPVPIHLEIDAAQGVPDTAVLSPPIQSLGYQLASDTPQSQLGPNGERLQRFIRQLTKFITQVTKPDYCPIIQLKLAGGLGNLFDQNIGRVLGAIYGLEQAARPYPLRINDPILLNSPTQQIKINRQLIDYFRLRSMKTTLAANRPIQSLADVKQFARAGAAHLIELSPQRLGTVQQSIHAIQTCHQTHTSVLLHDPTHPFASQFALATQPDFILATWESNTRSNIDQIYREMAGTITFFTQNHA